MILLGIDPGVRGAIALFDTSSRAVSVIDMPDTTIALNDAIRDLPPVFLCILEKPYYPRTIGVQNVAKIATAYGKIIGALTWRGIPVLEVTPASWKAALNLSSSKAASREKASQLLPDSADQWARVKDDGRAEAALLAWYGQGKVK
ncbi:MAG: hypothetical protein U5N55_10840 [Cypionkella sp.]|nr:hypothetical protein [Cypionkella sp.]